MRGTQFTGIVILLILQNLYKLTYFGFFEYYLFIFLFVLHIFRILSCTNTCTVCCSVLKLNIQSNLY